MAVSSCGTRSAERGIVSSSGAAVVRLLMRELLTNANLGRRVEQIVTT
jgi:hypothetical protein